MRTGTKSALDRDASNEDIEKNPLVIEAVKERVDKLSEVCQIFIDGIINSVDQLPYGLRWLCKQLRDVALV
jgi:Ras GTPase-activating-like protein IQGAP2/3